MVSINDIGKIGQYHCIMITKSKLSNMESSRTLIAVL